MAKKLTINKRILRCEYGAIVPVEYEPDLDIQSRFYPGPVIQALYGYVSDYMDKHVDLQGNLDKGKSIKKTSVYRVLLTRALLKEVHKRPQWQKDIVFDLYDADEVSDVLNSCIGAAAQKVNLNLSWKEIHRIWNMIKVAYGGAYAPPDAAIFDNFFEFTEM